MRLKVAGVVAARATNRAAFTLIELMVVAIVLAILAAAIIPNVIGEADVARRARAEADISVFDGALERFYLRLQRYPATEEGLRVLYFAPEDYEGDWEPLLKKPLFKDPWGNDYVYRSPGLQSGMPYEILSYGKDGQEGGEGDAADITSWVELEE
jgi:general secretion pathway protein G